MNCMSLGAAFAIVILPMKTIKQQQGNLDDAREITAVWTYFSDNDQVEQLFFFFK